MKILLFLFLACFACLPLSAQQKGAAPISQFPISQFPVTTRAVVIGISDYQDEQIPDLRFADKDATAFAAWLQSEAGAGLPPSQIRLLTNAQAKVGNMVAAFTWLIDECKPGDRAVIYFSGHGDVENVTMFQDGYLLGYDTPPTTYMAGGLSVYHFKRIIHTLSAKDVQVVTILDACRAGKLAGSEFGGAKATTAALMEQFENEVKILSCQPDEFSQEGEEWGGGRGCFSYHLIDGLYGLADRNTDLQVNLMEIGNYLEEVVPRETAPLSQIPMTAGNPKTRLSLVNGEWLTALKSQKAEQLAMLKSIESKGMEEMVLTSVDTGIQEMYKQFTAAIERGDLMQPKGKSADDYYRILIAEPELAQLHGLMKRNFAAALQNEAQEVTNKLLKTDPQVVSDTWSRPFVFDHIPGYLERAAEILGEEHFFYNQLKAKQYFFDAKTCRQEDFPGIAPDSLVKIEAGKLEKALSFDSTAAYVYLELSFLYFYNFFQPQQALAYAERALALSPNWLLAHFAVGNANRLFSLPKAEFHLQRALELDSTFLDTYSLLSQLYFQHGKPEKMALYRDKYIQKVKALIASDPEKVPVLYRGLLGVELVKANRMEEAVEILQQAGEMSKGPDWAWLGVAYFALERYEEGLEAGKRQLELAPFHPNGYFTMVDCYKRLNQPLKVVETLENAVSVFGNRPGDFPASVAAWFYARLAEAYQESGRQEEAKSLFQKILELLPKSGNDEIINAGRAWLGLGNLEAMQRTIDDGLKKFPGDVMIYYQAACLWSLAKEEQKALEWLKLALEKGFSNSFMILMDTDLDNIRQSRGFKALMKKYFPEYAPLPRKNKD